MPPNDVLKELAGEAWNISRLMREGKCGKPPVVSWFDFANLYALASLREITFSAGGLTQSCKVAKKNRNVRSYPAS
jgi:hypothetical protein